MPGSNRFSLNNAICSVAEREENKKLKWYQIGRCNSNKWILVFFIISILLLIISVGVYVGQTDTQWTTSSSTAGIVLGTIFTVILGGWFVYNNSPEKYAVYDIEEDDIEELKNVKRRLRGNHEQLDKYNNQLKSMNVKINAVIAKNATRSAISGIKLPGKTPPKNDIEYKIGRGIGGALPSLNISNSPKMPHMPNMPKMPHMPNMQNPLHFDSLEKRLEDREELQKRIKALKDDINKDDIAFQKLKLSNNKYNSMINLENQILKDLLKFEESYGKEEAKKLKESYEGTTERIKSLDSIINKELILADYEKIKIEQSIKIVSSVYENIIKIMPEYLESKERLESELNNEHLSIDIDYYIKNIKHRHIINEINKSGTIKKYNLSNISNNIGDTIKLFERKFNTLFENRYSKLDQLTDSISVIDFQNTINKEYERVKPFSIPFLNKYYERYDLLVEGKLLKTNEDKYKKENDELVEKGNGYLDKTIVKPLGKLADSIFTFKS